MGCINDRVFLVNASLGLYPQALEDREEQKRWLGRSRLVAAWAAIVTLWRGVRPLRLEIEHDGLRRQLRASTLFIGNNRRQLEQVGLPEASAIEAGKLGVVLVRALPASAMLWLLVKGALGRLREADHVEHFALRELWVRPRRSAAAASRSPRTAKCTGWRRRCASASPTSRCGCGIRSTRNLKPRGDETTAWDVAERRPAGAQDALPRGPPRPRARS